MACNKENTDQCKLFGLIPCHPDRCMGYEGPLLQEYLKSILGSLYCSPEERIAEEVKVSEIRHECQPVKAVIPEVMSLF